MMNDAANKIHPFESGLLKYFEKNKITLSGDGRQTPSRDIILQVGYIPEGVENKTVDRYHLRFIGDYPLQKEPYTDSEKRGICIEKEGLDNHPQFLQFKDITDLFIDKEGELIPLNSYK